LAGSVTFDFDTSGQTSEPILKKWGLGPETHRPRKKGLSVPPYTISVKPRPDILPAPCVLPVVIDRFYRTAITHITN